MTSKYRQHVHVQVHALVVWADVLDVLDAPVVWGQNRVRRIIMDFLFGTDKREQVIGVYCSCTGCNGCMGSCSGCQGCSGAK